MKALQKKYFIFTLLLFINTSLLAQIVNTATMDTSTIDIKGKLYIGGYVDSYYGYNFNQPVDGDVPYFVSSARHNEVNINLAYIDVKYLSKKVKARLVPGFGTYVNANYSHEPGSLKNLIEANVGINIYKTIWLDFGILGSPFTNESAISKDHLIYTRSLAPEYVPYYLSGAKLTIPITPKINTYFYVLNGWQEIQTTDKHKSVAAQIEYRPNKHWLLNVNFYTGNERSDKTPLFGQRYFSDIYFIYEKKNWSVTSCAYIGAQQLADTLNKITNAKIWFQTNVIGKYKITNNLSLASRIEYFNDRQGIQISNLNPTLKGFETWSASLGLNYNLHNNTLLRLECRQFYSPQKAFVNKQSQFVQQALWLTSNITVWF